MGNKPGPKKPSDYATPRPIVDPSTGGGGCRYGQDGRCSGPQTVESLLTNAWPGWDQHQFRFVPASPEAPTTSLIPANSEDLCEQCAHEVAGAA